MTVLFRKVGPVLAVWTLSLATFLGSQPVGADVKLPAVFGDHMVVQAEQPIPVWGWADPGERVTVSLAGQQASTQADRTGRWQVKLDPVAAGGPYELVAKGKNVVRLKDVLVGEVWLGSGQSNMAMSVRGVRDAEHEIATAQFPKIRLFTVARKASPERQADCSGQWVVCSPETVGSFSATAYFFGRELHKRLGVPVGLINSSWGGTPIEAWTRLETQREIPELKPILQQWDQRIASFDPEAAQQRYQKQLAAWKQKVANLPRGQRRPRRPTPPVDPRNSQHRPGNLYNGMIAPLVPFGIRGVIWYQGEHNSRTFPHLYGLQLKTLVADWRDVWKQGPFPFAWVQLPNFMSPQTDPSETSGWVLVREGMLKALSVPNTGMAITVDIGEANNIHPKNKQEVGRRLAVWALATVYGQDLVPMGPIYRSHRREGNAVIVKFDYVGDGLRTKDGSSVKGFAVAGSDRKFVWAKAEIVGKDQVRVWADEIDHPAAVRYAWASNPICNLYNSAGLPASPFRTDQWEEQVTGR